jgi:adenylate cyclase
VAYREQGWPEAVRLLEKVLAQRPDDGPSRVLLGRCRVFAESPPPPEWDGVFEATSK